MRNLKILGLALVASLALSAMAASAASANTAVVTPGHHIEGLFGEDNPLNHALTGVAGVECTTAHYEGTATTSTITLKPTFELCHTTSGAPATVTVNGCDYQLTLGGPLNGMVAPVKHVQLVCPGSAQIEVHVYGNVNHTIPACTINIPGQTPTPEDLTATDTTDGTIDIQGTVGGITSTLSGHCLTTPPFNLPHDGPIPSPVASVLHVNLLLGSGIGLGTQ
jgi:hypothetical protein